MTEGDRVKVWLREGEEVESLWATPVGPSLYQLNNTPFWAYGFSWNDTVKAVPSPDGTLDVTGVVTKGGHRTVRVFFEGEFAEQGRIDAVLAEINARGASYEGMNRVYVALDLPPAASLQEIAAYLTREGVKWEFADPPFEEVDPTDHPAPG